MRQRRVTYQILRGNFTNFYIYIHDQIMSKQTQRHGISIMLPILPPPLPRRISNKSLEPHNWTSHHLQKLDVGVDELCAEGPRVQIEPELDAALRGIYGSKERSLNEPLNYLACNTGLIDGFACRLAPALHHAPENFRRRRA